MGGQACVLYGATEFSRDCDITILCEPENLNRLNSALSELQAVTIAVPPFQPQYLDRGHAVHFRCHAPDMVGIRIDVMAKLRGVDPFLELWSRRTTIDDKSGLRIELMGLPDLVAAKKTQRDKDWPMLRRLVEAHYVQHEATATDAQARFWLLEMRTPELLIRLAARFPKLIQELTPQRPLLESAAACELGELHQKLADEERRDRDADRLYWEP